MKSEVNEWRILVSGNHIFAKIGKHKISTNFKFKMRTFVKNRFSFKYFNKQEADANATKPTKNNKVHLATNVLDIDEATNNYNFYPIFLNYKTSLII
jgi:hypothetical protein